MWALAIRVSLLAAVLACAVSYCVWQRQSEGFVGDEEWDFGPKLTWRRLGPHTWSVSKQIIVKITADASQLMAKLQELGEEAEKFGRRMRKRTDADRSA
jgi:hypothetical protein